MFVFSRSATIVAGDPGWAAQLLGKSGMAHYSAAFLENGRFRSFTGMLRLRVGKGQQPC